MLEVTTAKKNKISLTDYQYRRDLDNRLLMEDFSTLDLAVLEEILFSSIIIPIRKLAKNLDIDESKLHPVLEKFSHTGLFAFEGDSIVVDKEMRKYYESEIAKFEPDFKPDMEYLQGLLRKVPIHILPLWYAIPRSSNNIFDSIVEKYLISPQIFQRYLVELNLGDPVLSSIVQDIYRAPNFQLSSDTLIKKYNLTREQFEESMLLLEFNLLCCLGYQKSGDKWTEVVTPFHEWREYLAFLQNSAVKPISDAASIQRFRPDDYSFIQDMASVLQSARKQPAPLSSKFDPSYFDQILAKLQLLKLAQVQGNRLHALEPADEWLEMKLENRALYIYRHPLNRILSAHLPPHLCNERAIREAEKCITRVLYSGWITFDDFIKGVLVHLADSSSVILKKCGKSWRYTLPEYTADEKALFKAVVFEWLFEVGVIAIGTHQDQDCFTVTPFGQSLFG